MELSGDQTVRALVTLLQLAVLAGCVVLLARLSMREIGGRAQWCPLPVLAPRRTGVSAHPARDDDALSAPVPTGLPARAPPFDWGIPPDSSANDSALHRKCPARLPDDSVLRDRARHVA